MTLCANGWPALSSDSPLLHSWPVPTSDEKPTVLRTRNGSVGLVLCHLALAFDRRVEDVDEPVLDDWSYAYRVIRGYSTTLSNHAGYAVDLNATDHPLGVRGTFTLAQVAEVHRLLRRYEGVIDWGGDWSSRCDAMHFEIAPGTTMGEVEHVARKLMDTPRGKRILELSPGQRTVILS